MALSHSFVLANALWSYFRYLQLMVWPAKLAVLYPLLKIHPWQVALSATVLVAITVLAVWNWSARRYLLVGWLWYLGTLVPVIGIVQVGRQSMADRYAYVPLIGVFIMVSWGSAELAARHRFSSRLWPVAAAALLALCAITYHQLGYWHDSVRLFSHTVTVTHHNYVAEAHLGAGLAAQGHPDEGAQYLYAAVRDNPRYGTAIFDLGVYYEKKNDFPAAIQKYQEAIPLVEPQLAASGYANIGVINLNLGKDDNAEKSFRQALALNPNNFNSNFGLGKILYRRQRFQEAIPYLKRAVALYPTSEDLLYLGKALEAAGELQTAGWAYFKALQLDPDSKEAHNLLLAVEARLKAKRSK